MCLLLATSSRDLDCIPCTRMLVHGQIRTVNFNVGTSHAPICCEHYFNRMATAHTNKKNMRLNLNGTLFGLRYIRIKPF